MSNAHESWAPASYEWYTPPHVFHALGLHFDLDPCSPLAGPVPWVPASHHYTMAEDGLTRPWFGRVWCNPPYGDQVPRFVGRMADHGDGIMLVLSRTDTRWFHRAAEVAEVICFVRGRLAFVAGAGQRVSHPGSAALLLAFGAVCSAALYASRLGTCVAPISADRPGRLW